MVLTRSSADADKPARRDDVGYIVRSVRLRYTFCNYRKANCTPTASVMRVNRSIVWREVKLSATGSPELKAIWLRIPTARKSVFIRTLKRTENRVPDIFHAVQFLWNRPKLE